MRISDWSSDVCSSDLFLLVGGKLLEAGEREAEATLRPAETEGAALARDHLRADEGLERAGDGRGQGLGIDMHFRDHEGLADVRAALFLDDSDELGLEAAVRGGRSEEHTSELQSLMRNSYAVFCLKKKKNKKHQ